MSRSSVVLVSALLLAGASFALGGVIPVLPENLGTAPHVETFEGVTGVQLPLIEWGPDFYSPESSLPVPFALPSGVLYTSTTGSDSARIHDYGAPGYSGRPQDWGWGLSLEGGDIHYLTPFPSGTAFFAANCGWDPSAGPATVTFSFPAPVQMVGAYVESNRWLEIGFDGVVSLEAFDAAGTSLGQLSVTTDGVTSLWEGPPYPNGLDTWIGLGTDDGSFSIYSIAFHGYGLVADDLMSLPVPEPAALVLALFGALAWRRR